jgi:hypothetical protein
MKFVYLSVPATLLFVLSQQQQPRTAEQAFKNIQVIKTMPASQLQGAMSFMAASLGVDCSYCHTPPAMEKDDKPTKQTARRMLAMVHEINKTLGEKATVNCATCHRGQTKPATVPPLPSLASPLAPDRKSDQTELPAVDAILDRYINAIGGERAINKITSRRRKGSVQLGALNGTFELHEAAPNKSLFIGSLPAPMGAVHQGFDGSIAWVKNQSGVFETRGEGLAQARREANFHLDTKLKEQYSSLRVVGRERIADREFYVLEGTRTDGLVERLFFDVQTGLLTRRSWETPTYFGPLPNAVDYDDYRKVGSVRLPFIIRRSRAGTTFLQTISELKLNVAIDDSIFKKP